MKNQKRIRDYGVTIGNMKVGERNAITDVDGVLVGHCTLNDNNIKTGVTALLPHKNNIFKDKLIAGSCIINGFGKTTGLIQLNELGTLETPIILTNTLSVGTAYEALVEYMLKENKDIGSTTGTVNPIICECNDGILNDIRGLHVKKEHVFEALKNVSEEFEEGAVGAGTGMCCLGLKGGIGTASRVFEIEKEKFTMGALVLANFGEGKRLTIDGKKTGVVIEKLLKENNNEIDKGSIIMILATDLPLSSRQLNRICKRASVGLGRVGSYYGNGSGDIVIGFSTANIIKHYEETASVNIKILNENKIDSAFKAAAECVEEAILNALICADTTIGRDKKERKSLKEFIEKI
ncbi:P1 family peptidase [Abyssisolibacter fermentans]|uniref:DmpA family aminopeptidase n=1 Tax=Abyssisolibacter fermentans TaxID=1766203 RepID=UPI0008346FF1|nr:P1 family peptidase [Abyssisolibacter fermentans]